MYDVLIFFVTLPKNNKPKGLINLSYIKYKPYNTYTIMRTLKQYGGVILILLTVVLLAVSFFTDMLMDADTNHAVLGVSAALIIIGILLLIFGGKSADKIGGK